MLDFQLAPFIIAGLLIACGYMFTRWLDNLGQIRQWQMVARGLDAQVKGMREEGCAAMGALENIFNGVTAGGMPHSKLVRKIAEVATDALVMCAPCGHKEQASAWEQVARDFEACCDEAQEKLANWEPWMAALGRMLTEHRIARFPDDVLTWRTERDAAIGRAEEAERLLGLVNDRLTVAESYDSQADAKLQ